MSPALVTGEIVGRKRHGSDYHGLTVVAPGVSEVVKPGQFVNLTCGRGRAHILRRPFSVYRTARSGGWASTLEIVFDIRGPGTRELALLDLHDKVEVMGPLGRGFAIPPRSARCLLVGGGIGAAPLFFLADKLRESGHRVDVVLGARTSSLLLNAMDARRLASVCRITTEDGSEGDRGVVTDVLPDTIERCHTQLVYACGPHPMLAAVSRISGARDIPTQVAVEELMACGYGVCMSCVIPLRRTNGGPAASDIVYARACTEGPVFNGARIVWNGAGAMPPDQANAPPGN
jgi:dihydroorotate dehydrogenase electron transfer subunit